MSKYRFVKAPPDYPGKVYSWRYRVLEHHLVWWQNTKRLVAEGFELHHKNENGLDNRFENLEEIRAPDHGKLHHPKEPDVETTCAYCEKPLTRSGRDVKSKRKAGQQRFFCSSSHAALIQQREKKGSKAGHGTSSMYNIHGCRCEVCKVYNQAKYLRYKAKKGR